MADPAMLVANALRSKASTVWVVPEADGTRITYQIGGESREQPKTSVREGQALIDKLKSVCDMPIGRNKDLSGDTVMFANGVRVRVRVTTTPYRQQFERASIKLYTR